MGRQRWAARGEGRRARSGRVTELRVNVVLRSIYLGGAALSLFASQDVEAGSWGKLAYLGMGVAFCGCLTALALRPRVILEPERVRLRGLVGRELSVPRDEVAEFICGNQGVEIIERSGRSHVVMLVAAKSNIASLLGRTTRTEAALRRYLRGDAAGEARHRGR